MRPHALVVLGLLVLAALGPVPAFAKLDVLLKSGDTASDGRVLSGFGGAQAASAQKVALLGDTSAIITKSGGTYTLFAKTGDPLPIPLVGTFDSFNDPVINDYGNMVFRASLNSTSAESGLFFCCDGGAIVPIALRGGTSGGLLNVSRPADINNNDQVVFKDGTGDIYRWDLASQTNVKIVDAGGPSPGGGTFTRFGDRPVINNNGEVAFEGDVLGGPDGIFFVSAFDVVSTCALEGGASPIAGGTFTGIGSGTAVALNDYGQVAFVSNTVLPGPDKTGVYVCLPSSPSVLIAKEGDTVGSGTITTIDDEYVGIDASGFVAFEAVAASTRQLVLGSGGPLGSLATLGSSPGEFAPRLTPTRGIVWRRGSRIERFDGVTSTVTPVVSLGDTTPLGVGTIAREASINASNVVAFRAGQSALYTMTHGATARVIGPGDLGPGGDPILNVTALAYRGTSLAFSANEANETVIALKKGNKPIQLVMRTGNAAPPAAGAGATFGFGLTSFDVRGSRVVFATDLVGGVADGGIFRVNTSNGKADVLALQGDPVPGGGATLSEFFLVVASGNDAAFVAELDTPPLAQGIFLTNRNGLVTIAVTGGVLPDTGGGTLDKVSALAASNNRIAFTASVAGGTVDDGLFFWDHGQLRRVLSKGDPAGLPGATFYGVFGGSLDSGPGYPLAVSGKSITFIAPMIGGPASLGVFATRNLGTVSPILLEYAPTPLGGYLTGLDLGQPISRVGNAVVLSASLTAESGVAAAIVRAKP